MLFLYLDLWIQSGASSRSGPSYAPQNGLSMGLSPRSRFRSTASDPHMSSLLQTPRNGAYFGLASCV